MNLFEKKFKGIKTYITACENYNKFYLNKKFFPTNFPTTTQINSDIYLLDDLLSFHNLTR